jgi:hypothetical protein
MVVIGLPAVAVAGVRQERTGLPSSRTVQAPHWPSPQPYLVPGQVQPIAQSGQQALVRVGLDAVAAAVDQELEHGQRGTSDAIVRHSSADRIFHWTRAEPVGQNPRPSE